MPGTLHFPHLADSEAVRAEAAQEHGGLNDAAMLIQAHKAGLDPNTEQAALKKVNVEETEALQEDLTPAQDLIDEEYGEGEYRVLDAAIRGHALSVVAEDKTGRPKHLVVGWTEKWRPLKRKPDEAVEQANALAEQQKALLGGEMQAEVARQVAAAAEQIRREVTEDFEARVAEIEQDRADAADAAVPPAPEPESEGSANAYGQTGDGQAEPGKGVSGDSDGAEFPRRNDALDKIASDNNVTFGSDTKTIDAKIDALTKAGVTPPKE